MNCICGGALKEDWFTGLLICERCGWGYTTSGKRVCPACVRGDCSRCESFRDNYCGHECLLQGRYGSPDDVGYITATDW